MIPVKRLRGMYDLSQSSWLRQRDLQDRLAELFGSFGYRVLEMPVLESTELFLRKSGGELASQMFSFSDPGGNAVSLRPEFTSPVMRYYLEHSGEVDLPARWQYSGPVFRYDVSQPEASGQFTQVGAELLGPAGVLADAELLTLASRALPCVGIGKYAVELADLEVLESVLDASGISERARTFIIGSVPSLREGRAGLSSVLERAERLHLAGRGYETDYLNAAIDGLDDAQARSVLQGILQWTGGDSSRLGRRDPEDVVDRLLRKLRGSDETGKLERALALTAELAAVRGAPGPALETARGVVRRAGADSAALDRLARLLELLLPEESAGDHLTLDFGLSRGPAYYNGIIFEVKHTPSGISLGGGGRYDGLARGLGAPEPVPASGFAYSLESMLSVIGNPGNGHSISDSYSSTLALPEDDAGYPHALRLAGELRDQGVTVELAVFDWSLEEGLAYARRKGLSRVIVARGDGTRTVHEVTAVTERQG